MLYDLSGYTAGADTLIDEMLRRVDARNVAAEHRHPRQHQNQCGNNCTLAARFHNSRRAHDEFDQVRKALLSDPAIASSPAGQSGRIIIIDDRFLLCVSQYFVPAMEAMVEGLYEHPAATHTKS